MCLLSLRNGERIDGECRTSICHVERDQKVPHKEAGHEKQLWAIASEKGTPYAD